MAQTAKRFQVTISNARALEFTREKILAKLRMRSRPGNGTDIHQKPDGIGM
ncbi:MAG TPA: hypothetical protein VFV38_28405 [Ktedonobacteraceae bacterium]|nr:hypothetical protein [Ktedonobacteraceae bacterium]